jgi:serine/threonine-protein kinase
MSSEFEPGAQVGAWRVLQAIGRGGMSEVFAVVHTRSARQGALKVLHREAAAHPKAAERFAFEGYVLHEVRHPGVPEIFEFGHRADGRPYLVMELLLGITLAEAIAHRPLSRRDALRVLEQLCVVLGVAHERGVVHRDLKPENIILADGAEPTVKLLDWGVAKRLGAEGVPLKLTSTGAIVGTPRYLSPEQARAEPVDASTDVYALGLLTYELLLGVYPFAAQSFAEMLLMQMAKPPPSPRRFWPEIPDELERVIVAMLAKDPRRRPALAVVLDAVRRAQLRDDAEQETVHRMRAGELNRVETIVEGEPGERATSRWRPLRR